MDSDAGWFRLGLIYDANPLPRKDSPCDWES